MAEPFVTTSILGGIFTVNRTTLFLLAVVTTLLLYIIFIENPSDQIVYLEAVSQHESFPAGQRLQNLTVTKTSIFSSSPSIPLENVPPRNHTFPPVRVGWCPSWGEEYAAFLGPYLFPDGNYVYQKMDKTGVPLQGDPPADILICTGWNYAPELKNIRKQLKSDGRGVRVPEEYSSKWVDHVWFDKKDPILPHDDTRPFILSRNAEAWGRGGIDYDAILDCKREALHSGAPTIYVPWAAQSFCKRALNKPEDLILSKSFDASAVLRGKTKFMAFVTRDCRKRQHSILVTIRVAFYDYITKNFKKVDALGTCRHNADPNVRIQQLHLNLIQASMTYYDETVIWYAPYKFVITFENDKVTGYITEKIINAILANAIPIFFGAEDILDYVNPKRVIVCLGNRSRRDIQKVFKSKYNTLKPERTSTEAIVKFAMEAFGSDFEPCLKRIQELDKDNEKFKAVISEPFLPNNRLEGTVFDIPSAMRRLQTIMRLQNSSLAYRVLQNP